MPILVHRERVLQSEKRKTCRKAEDAEKEEKRGYINKQ
jgi:hypothetical protein